MYTLELYIYINYLKLLSFKGAWMSEFRRQSYYSHDGSKIIPIVVNNNNFAKGESATLLSFDDARTCFHEVMIIFIIFVYIKINIIIIISVWSWITRNAI